MKSKQTATFNVQAFLDSTGIARKLVEYRRGEVIFTQGDPCEHVLYIQKGGVKLSVLSKSGREAVVAMLGPGEFFGEGCLAGQPRRMRVAAWQGSVQIRGGGTWEVCDNSGGCVAISQDVSDLSDLGLNDRITSARVVNNPQYRQDRDNQF